MVKFVKNLFERTRVTRIGELVRNRVKIEKLEEAVFELIQFKRSTEAE